MDVPSIAKTTQEQAVASWINQLNQNRLDELLFNLSEQDINLESALEELQQLKDFVAYPEHILGSLKTKHGEIAEHVQVNIANARRLIEGLSAEYTFDGVDRTAPVDYLFNGIPVQSKYLNGLIKTLTSNDGVIGHLTKHPEYLNEGGFYHIPKDQYEAMQKLLAMSEEEVNKASGSVRTMVRKLNEFQQQTGIDLRSDKVRPALAGYSEVQLGKIDDTINKEEQSIKDTDQKRRDEAHQQSRPTLEEGAKATAISAAVEGGMTFCMGVARKVRSGKKIHEFTGQDWQDVGLDTAKGTAKGAIRGASVYTLTNFTATPAAVASSVVTASFGVVAQARQLRRGEISAEEFIENSEIVCLDATVSAIASIAGQMLIPIPMLGAMVGNMAGMFMYGIAKDKLSQHEQMLIEEFNNQLQTMNMQLEESHIAMIEFIQQEFNKFNSALELAFDLDVNLAFTGSIQLAQYVGVSDEKILKNKGDIDRYFLE